MKLLALLLALAAGFYALLLARHRAGLLEPVDELSADSALSDALPDYRRREVIH